jgi:peroxidase
MSFDFNGKVSKDMYAKSAAFEKMVSSSTNSYATAMLHAMTELGQKMETVEKNIERLVDVITEGAQQQQTVPEYKTWRTYDGTGNNIHHPRAGRATEPMLRISYAAYEDGKNTPARRGVANPNPRAVSNAICQGDSQPNQAGLTDMTWVWGQFIDHELDLTPTQNRGAGGETMDIKSPDDGVEEYPGNLIPFTRSQFLTINGVRQHPNVATSFMDASNVYGSDSEKALFLRRLDGTGKLKSGVADNGESLLIYNTAGLPNAGPPGPPVPPASLFLAGDDRSNENVFLLAMHTLWMREHNRLCDVIAVQHPEWLGQDEQIYQHVRSLVAGMLQHITFTEFLPALLGPGVIPLYTGYNSTVDPTVSIEFSTVAFRVGHTMLSSLLQVGNDPNNTLKLEEVFFTPQYVQQYGVDALLQGASKKRMQEIDGIIVESVRSLLFSHPGGGMMLDLTVLNVLRGRDHGIPGYNALRQAYGLPPIASFENMPTTPEIQAKFAALYDDVGQIDPWFAALTETHVPGSQLGPLLRAAILDQFVRSRDGDRFWFEVNPALTMAERDMIRSTTLSAVINRNSSLPVYNNVFRV